MWLGAHLRRLEPGRQVNWPPEFVSDLGQDALYLTRGLDGCIFGFAPREWNAAAQRFRSMRLKPAEARRFNSLFFAGVRPQHLNGLGRIRISKTLLEYAGLSTEVLVLGVVNRIELWNPQQFNTLQRDIAKTMAIRPEVKRLLGSHALRFLTRVGNLYHQLLAPYRSKTDEGAKHLFLCYATHDKDDRNFALRLGEDLVKEGVTVWIDQWEMSPGDSLYEKIPDGIQQAGYFGIVLSPSSVASKWCRRELHQALDRELRTNEVFVIPILYRTCAVPEFLQEKLYVDMRRGKYRKGLQLLLSRLQRGGNIPAGTGFRKSEVKIGGIPNNPT